MTAKQTTMIFLASCSKQNQVRRAKRRSGVLAVALSSVMLAASGMAYGAIRYAGLGGTHSGSGYLPVVTAGNSTSSTAVNPMVAPAAVPPSPLNTAGYAVWKAPVPTVSQEGFGYASRNTSFGTGLPVKAALEMILPKDWHVYAKPGVSSSTPVTWKSRNEIWITPLTAVLRQAGLNAVVNWPHQALLLSVRPISKTPALDTKGYTHWSASALPANFHVGKGHEDFAVPSTPSSPLQNATPVFLLNQGDLILTDLQKWAKQSGWTVIWQVPEDWQVPNTTTFGGDFQKAVSQVIQALSANGANVHAVFHTANNTVVISGAGGGE